MTKYFLLHTRKLGMGNFRSFCSKWHQPDINVGYNTGIKIYSCVAKKKVPLILKNKNLATWYSCGPTVYDLAHIGHGSAYVKLDIIQRILKDYFGINLITAMNITDIDDKILKKSLDSRIEWYEISRQYESDFWSNLKSLGVQEPNFKLRVTENLPVIIAFIEKLLNTKHAYIGKDGSVYFATNSYPNYGKLQKVNFEEAEKFDLNLNKMSAVDFALWKAKKIENEPSWSVPWGCDGRPGWHIECSAIATKIFGNCVDFHVGGLDLKFPHHENEEAQSCCYHGIKQWVNYWIHTGQLNLKDDSEKMSKSLKNTISISKFLEKYSSDEFRMACILSNYRNSMEYSEEIMLTSNKVLQKFNDFESDCQAYLSGIKQSKIDSNECLEKLKEIDTGIEKALKDDFNTAKCFGLLIELSSVVSKNVNTESDGYCGSSVDTVAACSNFIKKFKKIFGFNETSTKILISADRVDVTDLVDKLLEVRNDLRVEAIKSKNNGLFKISDQIREYVKSKNIEIKDHSKGSSWNFVKNSNNKLSN